jgi:hypothetical protein
MEGETETDEADEGLEPEGPILLPLGAACKNCHYSAVIRPDPKAIQSARICRRFPPNALFIPNAQGGVISSQPPIVPDDYSCFEYDERIAVPLLTGFG